MNIKKMRKRHKKEIATLQNNCKHTKISDWMPYEWAPGHRFGEVKVCNYCDKIVEDTWDKLKHRSKITSTKTGKPLISDMAF